MKTINIALDSIDKVNCFVHDMAGIEGKVSISLGCCYINAKSILGVFTLDLSKTLRLEISNWKEEYDILVKKYMAVQN